MRMPWKSRPMLAIFGGCLSILTLLPVGCGEVQQPQPEATAWDSPLPHSTKGYEMYSWYATEEEEWYYVLMTGTNRFKEDDELLTTESTVTEAGWVVLPARGTEELKLVLSRLPSGEEV